MKICDNTEAKQMKTIENIATAFYYTFYNKKWLGDSSAVKRLSIDEAYAVQDLITKKRIGSGERVAGFKIGCTSNAIREQFGLTEPINGKLFYPHIFDSRTIFDWNDQLNCAIEPEMVLKINKDLEGIDLSDKELINSIAYVSPGIEIHDYNFWIQPPTIQELICTGGIHSGLIVGDQRADPADLLFNDEIFYVYKDKSLITSAACYEIMGGPIHSLRWLVTSLTKMKLSLKKGSLVIPGSPVELKIIDSDTELKVVIDKVGSLISFFQKK